MFELTITLRSKGNLLIKIVIAIIAALIVKIIIG